MKNSRLLLFFCVLLFAIGCGPVSLLESEAFNDAVADAHRTGPRSPDAQPASRLVTLGLGQSNYEGPEGEVSLENGELVRGFDLDGRWVQNPRSLNNGAPYLEPVLPIYNRGGPRQCLGLYLADALAGSGREVSVIAAAKGGTSSREWRPGSGLYKGASKVAELSGEKISVIVVYQGEKNAQTLTDAASWLPDWEATTDALQAEYGPVPVIFVVLPETNPNATVYPGWTVVRAKILEIAEPAKNRWVVQAPDSASIHLGARELAELGSRLAAEVDLRL